MKTCSSCGLAKPVVEFAIKRASPDGLFHMCRGCKAAYNASYYKRTREIHNPARAERRRRTQDEIRSWLANYLLVHPCVDCGESDIVVLEFDHLRDKKFAISDMVKRGKRISDIIEEIKKCEVVCSNCHKRRTARTFGWMKAMPR